MYGLDARQVLNLVIRPSLQATGMLSPAAAQLMLGTMLVESRGKYIAQVKGPALGIWQVEPVTHDDIWRNYLAYQAQLRDAIRKRFALPDVPIPDATRMVADLAYNCVMARLVYRRRPDALPAENDALTQATYYKQWYNTPLGKSTVEKSLEHFRYAIAVSA